MEQCLFYDASYIKLKKCKVILCIMAINTEKIEYTFASGNQAMKTGLGKFIGRINCICSHFFYKLV